MREELMRLVVSGLVMAGALSVTAAPAVAQSDEASFYKGKTVRFVVGFGPGGGYDVYARMIAPHLSKALEASVVVENQPGAGGMTSLSRIYTDTPDGLRLTIVQGVGASLAQLLGVSGARYDLGKFEHLGTVSSSPWLWMAGPSSTFRTPQEFMASGRLLMWAGSAPTDGSADGAAFTCEALQLKCRIVVGYKGSADIAIAVARGEMDSLYVSDTSALNYVRASPETRIIATMARKRSRFFPDTPTIFELVKLSDEQAWYFDFHATVEDIGRILVTTPGVPAARLAVLRKAVQTVLTDPALIQEGERTQRYIDFVDADTTRQRVLDVVSSLPPEKRKRVQDIVGRSEGN